MPANAPSSEPAPSHPDIVGDCVESSLPCADCGYDLRTQRSSGRCPECNLSVSESIRAAGSWTFPRLRQVRRVHSALLIGSLCWIVPPMIVVSQTPTTALRLLVGIAFAGMIATLLFAGLAGAQTGSRQRRGVRLAIVGSIAFIALVPAGIITVHLLADLSMNDRTALRCLFGAVIGRGVLAIAALGALRHAAEGVRASSPKLWMVTAILVGLGSAVILILLPAMMHSMPGGPGERVTSAIDLIIGLALVAACLAGLPLRAAIRRRLDVAAG